MRTYAPRLAALILVLLPLKTWADPAPRLVAKLKDGDRRTWCVISPDGRQVCAYGWRRIDIWEMASGQIRKTMNVDFAVINDVIFAPGARSIIVAGRGNGAIEIYDLATGSTTNTLRGHRNNVSRLVMSPDGNTLASTERFYGGLIRLWNFRDAKEIGTLESPTKDFGAVAMAFSRDGNSLVVGGRRSVTVEKKPRVLETTFYGEMHFWNVPDKKLLRKIDVEGNGVGCMALSLKHGKLILAGDSWSPGLLTNWDVKRERWLPKQALGKGIDATCLAFSPDERLLVVGGYGGGFLPAGAVVILDAATGKRLASLEFASVYKASVGSLSFSADGRLLAIGGNLDEVAVYDVSTLVPPGPILDCRAALRETAARGAPVRGDAMRRGPGQMRSLWDGLISADASKAYQAMCELTKTPAQTTAFLAKHLPPIAPGDDKEMGGHVERLSSDQLVVREQATRHLQKCGELALPQLREALAGAPPLETCRRVERIIEKIENEMPAETLRSLRAIELLEWIGTPEAVATLRRIAGGMPEAKITLDSCRSLRRLAVQPQR